MMLYAGPTTCRLHMPVPVLVCVKTIQTLWLTSEKKRKCHKRMSLPLTFTEASLGVDFRFMTTPMYVLYPQSALLDWEAGLNSLPRRSSPDSYWEHVREDFRKLPISFFKPPVITSVLVPEESAGDKKFEDVLELVLNDLQNEKPRSSLQHGAQRN